jgi:beta-lactamase superfamily II metal-dependent hydrolase
MVLWPVLAAAQSNGKLQIHYMDVGQGDGAVLISPRGETVLLDDGVAKQCGRTIGYLQSLGVTKIDYHVASHYSPEHIGCAASIFSVMPLTTAAYDRGGTDASPVFAEYARAVGAKRRTAVAGQSIILDQRSANPVVITFVGVNGNGAARGTDAQDLGLVAVVRFGDFDAVFGGDIGGAFAAGRSDIEGALANRVGRVEVYKVHQHGGGLSSNTAWLSVTHPKVGMVSVGAANTAGYPSQSALNRLHAIGTRTYWTSVGNGAAPTGLDVIAGDTVVESAPDATTFTVRHGGLTDTYSNWGEARGVAAAGAPFGAVDTPTDGSQVAGELPFTGWAVDDSGISAVEVYRAPVGSEPVRSNGLVYLGNATFVPGARGDIVARYPDYPGVQQAGWGLMILSNMLPNGGTGVYRLYAYAISIAGETQLLGSKQVIGVNGTSQLPFGTIDTPGQGAAVSGVITNFGWVLAKQPHRIPFDGSTIDVYIQPFGSNTPLFRGHPVYNQYRTDIATLFPGYANSDGAVGYFQFDTTTLPNGLYSIYWVARDDAGNAVGLGSRYFTIANVPILTLTLSPNPAQAILQSTPACSGGVGTYTATETVTITETTGRAGQITHIGGTFTRGGTTYFFLTKLATPITLVPSGSVMTSYAQSLSVATAETNGMTFKVSVYGTDATGNPFSAVSADIPVVFPTTCGP